MAHELHISETVQIESPRQLSEVLGEAAEADKAVLPVGGGTSLSTGTPVDHAFLELDLRGLSGVVDYVPTDMTAAFLAGTPVQEVRAVLAEHGQELPVDLDDTDQGTIGGLVATGFSGERSYGQGTLKDLLIGCEYVRGDGLVAKAGGMTVKNVSGFEITRLLHGSWGSLAVLTRVNLKVLPRQRRDTTLVFRDDDENAAASRQQRLLASFPSAIAFQSWRYDGGWSTAVRFAGRESSVNASIQHVQHIEGEADQHETSSVSFWIQEPVSITPQVVISGTAQQVAQGLSLLAATPGVGAIRFSLATGTLRATLDPDGFDPRGLKKLESNLWHIEGGAAEWKRNVPVWGPTRGDRVVEQAIKNEFDPRGILNPGRLFI